MKAVVGLCVTLLGAVACQSIAATYDQPAHIVLPNDGSRAALRGAVNTALHTGVTLADSALTNSSVLIVERGIPQNLEGSPASGRSMQVPFQFRLVISGDHCVLIDQRDQTRYRLQNTHCVAAE